MTKGRRKTTSTTSKMPEDVPVTDMPEDSSPTSHDQDFVSFVRSTLSALNTKMDNLLTNQAESKLELIERRVAINTSVTTELSRATEFNSNIIKDQQLGIDTLQKSLAALSQDNVHLFSSLSSSRSFNVRFLGVPFPLNKTELHEACRETAPRQVSRGRFTY